jgi:predicted DCC family thiol-disulfide oxidoreductase YuxK
MLDNAAARCLGNRSSNIESADLRCNALTTSSSSPIILYDGICGLCDRFTQFVLKRDRKDQFRFASLQGAFAARILQHHDVDPQQLDTVYVVVNCEQPDEQLLSRSDAVVFILRRIGGIWRAAAALFAILPRWLRNRVYDLVARNRYRLFGKYETCWLPDAKYRHRFLDS